MDLSLITCAYNPNKEVFTKLINAVKHLKIPAQKEIEWIVVDNNSTPPIKDQYTFDRIPFPVHVVEEKKPGLTHARTRGIQESKGEWVIFFDDDNEPHHSYLMKAVKLTEKYANVAVWGAGDITVQFAQGDVNDWVFKKRNIFQERHLSTNQTDNKPQWQPWYPVGTGMVAKKEVLLDYVKHVESGQYNVADRTRKSLASGGDVQIVLHALKMENRVGSSPLLRINHWMTNKKATTRYLIRHAYGVNSSTLMPYNQVYSDRSHKFAPATNIDLLMIIYSVFRIYLLKNGIKEVMYTISKRLGECNARYMAYPENKRPWILVVWERMIE